MKTSLSPSIGANHLYDTMRSGKNQFQKNAYPEAKEYFKRVIRGYPQSYEAKEARFYVYMMGFLDKDAYKVNLLDGGYPDFSDAIRGLSEKIKEEQESAHMAKDELKAQKEGMKEQTLTILGLKNRITELLESEKSNLTQLAKLRKEVAESNVLHKKGQEKLIIVLKEKEETDKKLKELQESYQVMQKIEMRKERREKELRELGP